MKKLFVILFIVVCGYSFAQDIHGYYVKPDAGTTPLNTVVDDSKNEQFDKRPFSENKRVQVAFSTGASFMAFGGGNVFTTWVAPEVKYKVTDKFNLKVGTIAMYNVASGLTNYISAENSTSQAGRLAQYYLYAQGEYKYSERLTIRGTTMKEFSDQSINPHPYSLNHIGFDYKINNKMSISADFLLSKGNAPWGMYSNTYAMNNNNSFYSNAYPFSGIMARGW